MNDIINQAMIKFPEANRASVEDVTKNYERLDFHAVTELPLLSAYFKWNGHTNMAIRYVLKQKSIQHK